MNQDLNILETIKFYLDSVKQNNYNDNHEPSLQVRVIEFILNLTMHECNVKLLKCYGIALLYLVDKQYDNCLLHFSFSIKISMFVFYLLP